MSIAMLMLARLHDLALMLAQAPGARSASLRILTAMWLVAICCMCVCLLRKLLQRRRGGPRLPVGERKTRDQFAVILAGVALLLGGLLLFVITRG
jgi:hypothetical protein